MAVLAVVTAQALKGIVLPKSPMGQAIGSALRQWDALGRYLDDGRLEIGNNGVERQIRSVAVGRKNWLFAGSDEGGKRAAILYSVIGTSALQRQLERPVVAPLVKGAAIPSAISDEVGVVSTGCLRVSTR